VFGPIPINALYDNMYICSSIVLVGTRGLHQRLYHFSLHASKTIPFLSTWYLEPNTNIHRCQIFFLEVVSHSDFRIPHFRHAFFPAIFHSFSLLLPLFSSLSNWQPHQRDHTAKMKQCCRSYLGPVPSFSI